MNCVLPIGGGGGAHYELLSRRGAATIGHKQRFGRRIEPNLGSVWPHGSVLGLGRRFK
jgi:hypothetical protein